MTSSPPSAYQICKSNEFNNLRRVPNVELGTLAVYRHQTRQRYKILLDHSVFHGVGFLAFWRLECAEREWKLSSDYLAGREAPRDQQKNRCIGKGLEADIVVVGDNPLSTIEALKDIRMIVNDRQVILNKVDQWILTSLEMECASNDQFGICLVSIIGEHQ
jgi:hypothetical protein